MVPFLTKGQSYCGKVSFGFVFVFFSPFFFFFFLFWFVFSPIGRNAEARML